MLLRRICLAAPLLFGCNALLDIDVHPLGSSAGAPSAGGEGGASPSTGGTRAGGSTSSEGGSQPGNSGGVGATSGAEAGVPGEGGDTFGGSPGAGGDRSAGGTTAAAGGAASGAGGASSAVGGGKANGGATSAAGSANASGGVASSTGGSVTTNACNLECAANRVCVDGACVDCRNGERRCSADETPLLCVKQTWVPQVACAGAAPLCSNGACVGVRLIGGLVSVQGALSSSKVRLVQGSIELTKPTCSAALGKCVVGGLRP